MTLAFSDYTDTDRGEVLALWAEALPMDAITADTLESRVLLDENFDPRAFIVARDNNRIAGFILGFAAKRMPLGDADPEGKRCWITALGVRPGASPDAVALPLLAELEKRFRAAGKSECYIATYPPAYFTPGIDRKANAQLLQFLCGQGYQEMKQALSMDAPIVLFQFPEKAKEIERRLLAEGIAVRVYRRTDLLRFLDFLERTMPTDWVRVERANLKKISTGGFLPEQITVVTKGEEIIGYCQFEGSHFGPFGVSDAYQGRGIGTVLLGRTLERMRTMGYHDAWVMWTDDIAAQVYKKFGFTETRRFSILRKTF